MAGKPVATVTGMHVCPMCTGVVPHVGGPITGPGTPNILINGKPAAVMGDLCTCAGPPDVIVTGNPSVLFNGKPVACMGDMTAHGGSIVIGEVNVMIGTAVPEPSAVMKLKDIPFPEISTVQRAKTYLSGNSKKLKEAEDNQAKIKEAAIAQEEKEPEEVKEVTLTSEYAMKEFREFARQFSHATFYLFMSEFFGKDIPISAYKKLYDAMSREEYLNPDIKVKSMGAYGSFYKELTLVDDCHYEIAFVEIRVSESIIRDAANGETEDLKNEALSLIFKVLLEEYGHYIDYLLRFVYSSVAGDAEGDEGAEMAHLLINQLKEQYRETGVHEKEKKLTYSQAKSSTAKNYFLATYNPFEDDKIEFGKATVDGASHTLILDFSEFKNTLVNEKSRIEADIQTANEEFFAAGLGEPKFEHYGHLGIEKVLENSGFVDVVQLSHIYLGNYMRDMSQIISPIFTYLNDGEKAKLDAVEKDLYGFEWLDSIKLSREGLCNIIELLAANEMSGIVMPDKATEAIGGKGKDIVNPSTLPDNKVKDKVEKACIKIGLKGIQVALNYRLFVKYYGGFTPDELGVYRPEEHIDSPLYATVFDNVKDEIFYCSPTEKPRIGSYYGMKRHIKNEENGIETKTEKIGKGTGKYASGNLPTAISYMEEQLVAFYNEYEKAGTSTLAQNKALRHMGNALHVLEDFFAHTNFTELSLIKMGISVYPWVDLDDPQLKNYPPTNNQYVVDNTIKKKYFVEGVKIFDTKAEIKAYYRNFKLLDEFEVDGFYFSTSDQEDDENARIMVAARQSDGTLKVSPAINSQLQFNGNDYVKYLPLVSGYFSGSDSAHSLIHALEGVLEPKPITLKGILMENDGVTGSEWEKFALELSDMIILHVLADLKLSQKEKNKSGLETGVDYSGLMEHYMTYIEYRQILISAIAAFTTKNPSMIFLTEVAIRIINTAQAAITNMVKKIIIESFELLAKSITAIQNMQLLRTIGTDPSHSQLAKDHFEHPLHSLAADLAREAVKGVGSVLNKYFIQKRKQASGSTITEKPITGLDFVNSAKYYLVHPAQNHWMNSTIEKWVGGHGKKLADLHEIEKTKKLMHVLGEKINYTVAELKAQYITLIKYSKEVDQFINQKIKELQNQIEYLKTLADKIHNKIKQEYQKIMEKIEQQLDYLKKNLNLSLYELEEGRDYEKLHQETIADLDVFSLKSDEAVISAVELIKDSVDNSFETIDNLQTNLTNYYSNLFQNYQKIPPFESKVYSYIRKEVPKDAEKIEYFYKQQNNEYAKVVHYLENSTDHMFAILQTGNPDRFSFFESESQNA